MSPRMARTMSKDTADRGTMGRAAGSLQVAPTMRKERGYDGLRGFRRIVIWLSQVLLLDGGTQSAGGVGR